MATEMELVWIRWIDASQRAGWHELDDAIRVAADGSLECESVGWVIREDEDSVSLAPNKSTEEQVADITTISKRVILERVPIRG